jgi:hypothetical protein
MMAASVFDGAITEAKLAPGAVETVAIAASAVTVAKIDTSTVQQRVSGTAPTGEYLTGINQDGTVISAVPTITLGFRILWGTWDYYGNFQAGSGGINRSGTSFSFSLPFSAPPAVILTANRISNPGATGAWSVESVSTSGFEVRTGGAGQGVTVIAVGPP